MGAGVPGKSNRFAWIFKACLESIHQRPRRSLSFHLGVSIHRRITMQDKPQRGCPQSTEDSCVLGGNLYTTQRSPPRCQSPPPGHRGPPQDTEAPTEFLPRSQSPPSGHIIPLDHTVLLPDHRVPPPGLRVPQDTVPTQDTESAQDTESSQNPESPRTQSPS